MTVQSDLQAAQRGIKLQSDGLKKDTELDHVFARIQRHDCGEPEELINNQQEPKQRPTRHVWDSADCFIEAVCEAASSHNSGSHSSPLRRRPLLFCSFCGFFMTDFDKRCRHMCAACVPRPDQGGSWKKHFSTSSKGDGSLSVSLLSA